MIKKKIQKSKKGNWASSRLKTFALGNTLLKERQATRLLVIKLTKDLQSEYKEYKQEDNLIKKVRTAEKNLQHFFKENILIKNEQMKRCPISWISH